ncbi:MAG: ATP-grasp domain-containing protein [Chloroflexota bacterium]
MRPRVATIYNHPEPDRYGDMGEAEAVLGIMETVEAVGGALSGLGYPVTRVPLQPPLEHALGALNFLSTDVVFNLFEGFDGRPETEAVVADALSSLGLTFTGCPGNALALALDKARAKSLLKAAGISTPAYCVLSPGAISRFNLNYPCIVKPLREDASHGLSEENVVRDQVSLERQVARVSEFFGGEALVEEFVGGREFNVTVLGDRELSVLPVSEIVYSLPPEMPRVLTFAAKWEPGSLYFRRTKPVCPARIGAEERERIGSIARAAFTLFGCRGYARMDMRLDRNGVLNVLEVNPNPDISPGTGAARQAEASGLTYAQFMEKILLLALEKDLVMAV